MIVKYNCSCLKEHRDVCVPDRVPGTDIIEWMNCVGTCLGYDHRMTSPTCPATAVKDVMIPVNEGAGLGEKPTFN